MRETQFIVLFLGVNFTFFPIHFLGIQGIPRRYRDYHSSYTYWHAVASLGRILRIVSVGILFFI